MNNKMYRQGDVLMVSVDSIPDKKKTDETNILVYGETTGHAHRLVGGQVFNVGENKYFVANSEASVVHEEHDTIKLPEGNYKVIRQREYDENEIRYVRD